MLIPRHNFLISTDSPIVIERRGTVNYTRVLIYAGPMLMIMLLLGWWNWPSQCCRVWMSLIIWLHGQFSTFSYQCSWKDVCGCVCVCVCVNTFPHTTTIIYRSKCPFSQHFDVAPVFVAVYLMTSLMKCSLMLPFFTFYSYLSFFPSPIHRHHLPPTPLVNT